jgi:hypothetical protein
MTVRIWRSANSRKNNPNRIMLIKGNCNDPMRRGHGHVTECGLCIGHRICGR